MVVTSENLEDVQKQVAEFLVAYEAKSLPACSYANLSRLSLEYLQSATVTKSFAEFRKYIKGIGAFELGILEGCFGLILEFKDE